jgi:hypothetical protein
MNIKDFSVEIRKSLSRGKLLAVASLSYLDPEVTGFRIRGFKIMKGNYSTGYTDKEGDHIWVAPPSYHDPVTDKLSTMFFMPKPLWQKLESQILAEFIGMK